jgi:hypothetical protein
VLFVSPLAVGVVLGIAHQKNYPNWLRQITGIAMIHPIPTSWDYAFSTGESCWVIVTLKDGSQVAGFWGPSSFASSDPKERDIFIEKVFKIPKRGAWKEVPRTSGILLRGDEIQHIEFRS